MRISDTDARIGQGQALPLHNAQEKRTMSTVKRLINVAAGFVLALAIGMGITLGGVGGWADYLLHSATVSITADATGTGRVIADYGVADCYQIVDIGTAQRVTTTMAHSPDNSNWVDGMVFPGRQADGVDYLSFPITGTYIRASVDIMTAGTGVTVTLRCTAKDKSN